MSFGMYDNSEENNRAIERFKDAKRTGSIRPIQVSADGKMTHKSIQAYLKTLSDPRRFSEGQLRNQGVNQCRFGAGGNMVIGPNDVPCGYGVLLPQEMSGLVEATSLRKNDAILFKVNLILPAHDKFDDANFQAKAQELADKKLWDQLAKVEEQAADFYFTEGQVEGVIEEAYPNSSLLGGEGIVYKVIPTFSRLSEDARQNFNISDKDKDPALKKLTSQIPNVAQLNKHVVENYIPLKIGRLPIVYWVGVYNDMKTAQAVVTTNYVTYKQLEEHLYTQAARVILGAYPVTELTHDKSRSAKPSSSSSRTR
jgi:hypothetical protein